MFALCTNLLLPIVHQQVLCHLYTDYRGLWILDKGGYHSFSLLQDSPRLSIPDNRFILVDNTAHFTVQQSWNALSIMSILAELLLLSAKATYIFYIGLILQKALEFVSNLATLMRSRVKRLEVCENTIPKNLLTVKYTASFSTLWIWAYFDLWFKSCHNRWK